jgi:hypothetical protein
VNLTIHLLSDLAILHIIFFQILTSGTCCSPVYKKIPTYVIQLKEYSNCGFQNAHLDTFMFFCPIIILLSEHNFRYTVYALRFLIKVNTSGTTDPINENKEF